MKIKRNDKCPCNSGKKFKKCHWNTELGNAIQGNFGSDYIEFISTRMKQERK